MYSTDMLYAGGVQGHRANKLLAALEQQDFGCLEQHLEIVKLQHGQVLCEAGQPLHYAYFPHNVIISLMAVMHDGRSADEPGERAGLGLGRRQRASRDPRRTEGGLHPVRRLQS